MKHLNEEQLILYHYGESPAGKEERAETERHLAACAACRAQYDALKNVLAAVDAVPVPERGEDYAAQVWQQIRPRLDEHAPARGFDWRAWFHPQRLAWAGAMAVMLLAAFFAGRFWPPHGMPVNIAGLAPEQVRERILLIAVGEHLERSQMVLVELSNAPADGKVDISSEQRMASELVGANRLYRQTALNSGEAGVASVLDQLERVLVEIANSPPEMSSKELESLRKRIESQGILFKVRVIGSQVRERSRPAPAPQTAPGGPRKTT